jgi:hypothetical protein
MLSAVIVNSARPMRTVESDTHAALGKEGMPTYVSMVTWTGDPQPEPADVRDAIADRGPALADAGLRSVVFLPDEEVCCAVMVSTCDRKMDAERLASEILSEATVRVDSTRFDDIPPAPGQFVAEDAPPSPTGYLGAVLEAVDFA